MTLDVSPKCRREFCPIAAGKARCHICKWPKKTKAHVRFVCKGRLTRMAKTMLWHVYTNRGNGNEDTLGAIRWWSGWRCYVFAPAPMTFFSEGCLEEIYAFINARMAEHRVRVDKYKPTPVPRAAR